MNEDRAHFIPQCFEGIVRPRVNVFPHAHTFHEIVYCASGKGIQHAGQLSFPMSEGDLLFLPAGMDHLAETVTESVILHVVYFSDTSLGDIPGPCDIPKAVIDYLSRRSSEGNCVVPLDAASRRRAKSIIARLMDETYGRSAGHVLALLLGLLAFQYMLWIHSLPALLPSHYPALFQPPVSASNSIIQPLSVSNHRAPALIGGIGKSSHRRAVTLAITSSIMALRTIARNCVMSRLLVSPSFRSARIFIGATTSTDTPHTLRLRIQRWALAPPYPSSSLYDCAARSCAGIRRRTPCNDGVGLI